MSVTISYDQMQISLVLHMAGKLTDSFLVTGPAIRKDDDLTVELMKSWNGRWNDHSNGFTCLNKNTLLERAIVELCIEENDLGKSLDTKGVEPPTPSTRRGGLSWTVEL